MDKLDSQKSGLSMQDQLNKSSTIIGAIPLEKIAQIKEKVRARQRAVMKPSDDDIKADGVCCTVLTLYAFHFVLWICMCSYVHMYICTYICVHPLGFALVVCTASVYSHVCLNGVQLLHVYTYTIHTYVHELQTRPCSIQVRGITGDTMDDFISREKQHRTRTTVLQSAGKVTGNAFPTYLLGCWLVCVFVCVCVCVCV